MEWNIEWEAEDKIFRMSHCSPFVKSTIITITSSRSPSCTPARPINPNGSDDDAIWMTVQSYSYEEILQTKYWGRQKDASSIKQHADTHDTHINILGSPRHASVANQKYCMLYQYNNQLVMWPLERPIHFNRWSRSWVWAGVEMVCHCIVVGSVYALLFVVAFCVASIAL